MWVTEKVKDKNGIPWRLKCSSYLFVHLKTKEIWTFITFSHLKKKQTISCTKKEYLQEKSGRITKAEIAYNEVIF